MWAYLLLGVAAFPSIAFPGVVVFAQVPGASAQTMASTVMAPLERHLGRIPGIKDMTGDAGEGSVQIQILFDFSRNADQAARDVQQAINAAAVDLPSSMPVPPQYFKFDTSQIPILFINLTSTGRPVEQLFDLTDTLLKPAMAQIPGVAQVQVSGGTPRAVRIALDTAALTAKGITSQEVANALRAANVSSPQGTLSNGITQTTVTANDALHTVSDFAGLIIGARNGVPIRLRDVATISSGQQDKYAAAWFGDQRSVSLQISKRPEANSVATVNEVRARLPALRAMMPADVTITPIFDLTRTTESALHEVEIALLISIAMVALVMLVFLRRVRPMLIAMISVPLSLAGALVTMWALGFTLNIFSLIALVLCVGFVVDDAIVVIENIMRHVERGERPLAAAMVGVGEIGFTVVSITLSLVAVFAPMVFGHNTFTVLMREFAVTLVATIVISAVVSLTLTAALCGRYLSPESANRPPPGRLERWAERFDNRSLALYQRALDWAMHHRRLMRWQPLLLLVLTVALGVAVVKTAGGGVMPKQDTGELIAQITADANISPVEMARRARAASAIMQRDPAVLDVGMDLGSGNGGSGVGNSASMYVDLKPFGEGPDHRQEGADAIIRRLTKHYDALAGVQVSVRGLQFFGGGGGGGNQGAAYSFQLVSNDGDSLQKPVLHLAKVMRAMKQVKDVTTGYDTAGKQQTIAVDREAASRLGVSVAAVDSALYNAFGQNQVSTIYSDINQYRVVLTASNADALSPGALLNLYVRASSGQMVPLSAVAKIKPHIAPTSVQHYNQRQSASVSYNLAKGVTQAQGLALVDQAIYKANLPPGVQKQYTGDNQQLTEIMTGALVMLFAVIAAMYIVLGILYESFIHPLTILSTLPAAGMGAFLAMLVTHTQLTMMSIIAILMLIGIVKKNAILMVDFALVAEREHGMSPPAAIREAALVRFRPITMTTLVAMGAALPLAIGFGVGSEMRQPLGIAILGGLLVSQLLTLLSTPAIYLWQHDRRERKAVRQARKAEKRRLKALKAQTVG